MYPNIAISNRVFPEHLGESFCDIYQDVYEQRKSYPKSAPENLMLKLALNSVYGDSNNQYSVFYDPKYTMTITINGQLSLCMLADWLMQEVPGVELIQVNTDGVTVRMPKESEEIYMQMCERWQKQVKLELEYADYSKMILRDVNNYIAVYTNGKLKSKGAYVHKGLGWHQNHSALVIPRAAEEYMINGTALEDTIKACTDPYDFMLRTKVNRDSRLVLQDAFGEDTELQRTCRYYVCKKGGEMFKMMPALEGKTEERRMSIESGWKVLPCNSMLDYSGEIDYDYYIAEAQKLVVEG